MKLFISIIYTSLFIISEFRLKSINFLVSIPYAIGLLGALCGVLAIDSFVYEFSALTYFILSVILTMQVYSFLCRIYLFHNDNQFLRIFHPQVNEGELYNPRSVTFYDCAIMLIICLYIYISLADLRRLKLKFDF